MLGARPYTVEQIDTVSLLIEVAVSVAGEVSGAVGDGEGACDIFARVLGGADVCLLIAKTEMLGPELRPGCKMHAGVMTDVDHLLVEPLGVHIDLDGTACAAKGFKDGLPEGITSFRNAALAVDAKGDTFDLRTELQQFGESVATVSGMGLRGQAEDVMIGVWACGPLI